MATVSNWNPFGVAMNITATGSNIKRTSATQFTVTINASWEVVYSGNQTNYGMKASSGGQTKTLSAFDGTTKFSSGSGSFTGTYSISGNGAQTKTITVKFENYKTSPESSATKNVTFDVNVPAWTSYTVSYDANGGTGAPSSQTKWKDQTLTLSSTKPIRTGYAFKGWGTSTTDTTVDYSAGGSYTANASDTLYAIWTENALTVNYYSNYATESFADALNTVDADKNVIVRTVKFYYDNEYPNGHYDYSQSGASTYLGRIGYTGTGYWGTSTNGGTLVSQSKSFSTGQAMAEAVGKSLKTGNASVNLYAQWEINTYTITYNSNGGTSSMNSQTVEWNELFTFSKNAFVREGYKFIGWNLYRNDDNKWYAESQGWKTEDEIISNEYSKRIYIDQRELTLDESWIRGNEFATTEFTLYAIWEISGVIYIDNGVTFEPYLTYIDNGTSWDLYLVYIDNGTKWDLIS